MPDSAAQDQHRFRAAMMASPGIGIAIVDLQGRCLQVNPAFERLFGFKDADLAGREVSALAHPDDAELIRKHLRHLGGHQLRDAELARSGLEDTDLESRYLHRDGRIMWTQASVGVMRDDPGQPVSLVVQMRDITAQREASEAQRNANRELERQVRACDTELKASRQQLDVFASGITHDLRAPLRMIESLGKLLEKRAHLQPEEHDYLQRMLRASQRISHLLDGLAELAHVTTSQLAAAPVDLTLLAEWTLAELQEEAPERVLDVAVDPDLIAHGDERLLKTLMAHLLRNAWTFSRDREVVWIRVEGKSDAGGLHLRVRDRGRGIDMRYADKLFQPFQRQHNEALGAGHGLGLAVAHRIAQRHGGRVWADSEVDSGSVFHVWLPSAEQGSTAAESIQQGG